MSNKTVAFLVMKDPSDYVTDYHLAEQPLAALGWELLEIPWRSGPDWADFDAVYICSPWDYPQHADEFFSVLQEIQKSAAVLMNPLSIVEWNLDKIYLRDIEARGDAIVPSIFPADLNAPETWFETLSTDRLVIKPTIGGNALDTYVLDRPLDEQTLTALRQKFSGRSFIVQPFIENIRSDGEYSLFFFNGEYSHTIRKVPKYGDFRVQEEHGADILPVTPPQDLVDVAHSVFGHVQPLPVYGRGDWVRGPQGDWLLMELELIEPSLYLRTDRGAAARFARALDERFQEFTGK